jgi:hypothetical protein
MSVFFTDIQKTKPLLIKYLCQLISRLAQMAKVELRIGSTYNSTRTKVVSLRLVALAYVLNFLTGLKNGAFWHCSAQFSRR